MIALGKPLTKRHRFWLLKDAYFRRVIIWKNRKRHSSHVYSLINFSRLFDVDYYLRVNPDVASVGMDPIQHYIEYGASEFRNPAPWFNTKYYVEDNKLTETENPFLHFILNSKVFPNLEIDEYQEWIRNRERFLLPSEKEIKSFLKEKNLPTFTVLMPVYNSPVKYLKQAVESVKKQLYPNWELCIADDASTSNETLTYLQEINESGEKIKVVFRKHNGHISESSNSALAIATGSYVVLLDHDDMLPSHSLYEVAKAIKENPKAALIYSDEDKIDEDNNRFDPYFKCKWNKDLLYSQNYVSHLGVYKTNILKHIGGFRKGYEGSQDYDMLLRFIEHINEDEIIHIPQILYHWRAIVGSTALNSGEKNYAAEAGKKALEDHLKRSGIKAEVSIILNTTHYRVKRQITSEPKVSIIIPFKDQKYLLEKCVNGILKNTTYNNFEILLINNQSREEETHSYLSSITEDNISVLNYNKKFNYSAINNFAAKEAKGDILLLLNNDTEPINQGWMEEIISQVTREEVGAVGVKLFYEDDTVQHAGVVLGMGGIAAHWHKGISNQDPGYKARASIIQELSAVTGACMAIRKEVFEEVGGFDENLRVAFNDIDLCIKIRSYGYKIIYTPFSLLYHYESKSRGSDLRPDRIEEFQKEINYLASKWPEEIKGDHFYSPHLNLELNDRSFADYTQ